jgi:hypothetical protein
MFNQDFLDAFDHHRPHWFLDALSTNSLADTTPRFGCITAVWIGRRARRSPLNRALHAVGEHNAAAVDVAPAAHDPSMLAAAPLIVSWLRELEAAAK